MTETSLYSGAQITLMVPDMDEAVRFYTEKLRLKLKARYGNEFAMVEGPGLTIGLHPKPAQPSPSSPSISIGLGVESLETAMEELQARGVEFVTGIVADSPIRIAHFTGPAGMPIYLVEQSGWR